MANLIHHIISMSEMPTVHGNYLFGLEEPELSWSQESHWLLLVTDHPGIFSVGARTQTYEPWATFVVPPGHRCHLRRSADASSCAFWGRFVPSPSGGPTLAVPSYKQLGEFGPMWFYRLRLGLNRTYQMRGEMRCAVTDLLWTIGVDPGIVRSNPALAEAERIIEDSLGERLRVETLAAQVGVSHNQLTRMFQEEHGVGPLEFLRHRRQNLACRLLLETDTPIKQIAAAVGIADLAQFSRLVKSASGGLSPRELRATTRPANPFRT
jgi:AraC-like DNA-binding protein